MDTAISTLSVLPSNKKEAEQFAEMLKKEILIYDNPLSVLILLKRFEALLTSVLKDDDLDAHFLAKFKEQAKDNKLEGYGAILTSQEFGARYSYDTDQVWTILDKEIKTLTEKRKAREEILKSDEIKIPGKPKVVVKL